MAMVYKKNLWYLEGEDLTEPNHVFMNFYYTSNPSPI